MLGDARPDTLQLLLDLRESLDVLRMRYQFSLVLFVRLLGDLCLLTEIDLRGELSFSGSLVGRTKEDHVVLERFTFLLEIGPFVLVLSVKVGIFGAGGGEIGGEGVKSFSEAGDFGLSNRNVSTLPRDKASA